MKKDITRHHRKPRCKGGDDSERNISLVNREHHRAYHRLFDEGHPSKVAERLNKYWIDPDYVMIPIPKKFAEGIKKRISSYIKSETNAET